MQGPSETAVLAAAFERADLRRVGEVTITDLLSTLRTGGPDIANYCGVSSGDVADVELLLLRALNPAAEPRSMTWEGLLGEVSREASTLAEPDVSGQRGDMEALSGSDAGSEFGAGEPVTAVLPGHFTDAWRDPVDVLEAGEARGRAALAREERVAMELLRSLRVRQQREASGASAKTPKGRMASLRGLLGSAAGDDGALLHAAVALGRAEVVVEIARSVAPDVLESEGPGGTTPLAAAVRAAGSQQPVAADVVAALLSCGAVPHGAADQHGWAPVHYAAAACSPVLLSALLAAVPAPAVRDEANRPDSSGQTPLHVMLRAAARGCELRPWLAEAASVLCDKGADLTVRCGSESPALLLLSDAGSDLLRRELDADTSGRLMAHLRELWSDGGPSEPSQRRVLAALCPFDASSPSTRSSQNAPTPHPAPTPEPPPWTPRQSPPQPTPVPQSPPQPPRDIGGDVNVTSPHLIHLNQNALSSLTAASDRAKALLGALSQSATALEREVEGNAGSVAEEELLIEKLPSARMGTGWEQCGSVLLLAGVEPSSPAALSGAKEFVGRRLVRVNGRPAASAADVKRAAEGNLQVRLQFASDGAESRRGEALRAAMSYATDILGFCEDACLQGTVGGGCLASCVVLAQDAKDAIRAAASGPGDGSAAACAARCDALLAELKRAPIPKACEREKVRKAAAAAATAAAVAAAVPAPEGSPGVNVSPMRQIDLESGSSERGSKEDAQESLQLSPKEFSLPSTSSRRSSSAASFRSASRQQLPAVVDPPQHSKELHLMAFMPVMCGSDYQEADGDAVLAVGAIE